MTLKYGSVSIGELLEEGVIHAIQDGNHGEKHPKTSDYVEDGIPFIMANSLNLGFVDLGSTSKISEEQASSLRIGFATTGDVLLTHKGTIGNTAIVPQVDPYIMLTPQVTYYRLDQSKLSNAYLLYCFRDLTFQKTIKSLAQQSTRPYIGITAQRNLKINFRDINEQIRIVDAIKPYDDLIENNRRRIQLLEESARLLYQEWFIHLRFPGHEQAKITDGVPDGWEESTLGSLASVQSGYAFKSKDWLDAGNPVIKIKNITGDGTVDIADCQCVDDNVAEKAQKFKLEEGDFLIAMTGATVGKVGIMPRSNQTYYLNQRVGKFEFVGETSREFVFCLANTKHFRNQIENLAGGAAQPNISGKQIESIKVLRPSDKLLSFFSEQTHNLFEQRQLLVESNKKLAQARDLLLPKLMSGELTV